MPSKSGKWLTLPQIEDAIRLLNSHYALLGCPPGSPRLDSLIHAVFVGYGSESLSRQFRYAMAMAAEDPDDARAITALARVTWATFCEPPDGMAEIIDAYGLAADHKGVSNPGAFGRLWCRQVTDIAWLIWTTAGSYGDRVDLDDLDPGATSTEET